MNRVRWTTAPTGLDGAEVRLDNVAILPASLMPHNRQYRALANQLPAGSDLVVISADNTPEHRLLQSTAGPFRAKGHLVAVLTADQVLGRAEDGDTAPPAARTDLVGRIGAGAGLGTDWLDGPRPSAGPRGQPAARCHLGPAGTPAAAPRLPPRQLALTRGE